MVFESESIQLFLQVVGLNLQLSDQAWVTMGHVFEYVLFKRRMKQLVLSIPNFFKKVSRSKDYFR